MSLFFGDDLAFAFEGGNHGHGSFMIEGKSSVAGCKTFKLDQSAGVGQDDFSLLFKILFSLEKYGQFINDLLADLKFEKKI